MARKKRGKKQAKKVLSKIRKAPNVKKASKPVRKAIKKALKNNKGNKPKFTKREIKNIIAKGGTKKQIQKIRKVAKNSKKLSIGKKVDQKKEIKRTFKKTTQRPSTIRQATKRAGKDGKITKKEIKDITSQFGDKGTKKITKKIRSVTKGKDIKLPEKDLRKIVNKTTGKKGLNQAINRAGKDGKITKKEIKNITSQHGGKGTKKITKKIRKAAKGTDIKLPKKDLKKIVNRTGKGKKGIDINKNVITPSKVQGKGYNPGRVEDSAKSEWTNKFKNYRGPKRIKVKDAKLPSRLRKYSQYDKKTGNYKGFDTKRYMKGVGKDLRQRYKAKGGTIRGKDKIDRMIKRDGPKANFNVKPKYSKTMDKLRDQLGGDVNYKRTLGSVTKSLAKEPKVREGELKESGMSLLKPRTTEDTAVPMKSTIKTDPPRQTKKTTKRKPTN
jgi:uncharacterized protein YneF (UPF0154 family)